MKLNINKIIKAQNGLATDNIRANLREKVKPILNTNGRLQYINKNNK